MNPFIIEEKKIELINRLPSTFGRVRLFNILDFYSILFESKNHLLIDSYINEFIEELLDEIDHIKMLYLPCVESEKVIFTLNQIQNLVKDINVKDEVASAVNKLNHQNNIMKEILEGRSIEFQQRLSFPLLYNTKTNHGEIETIKLKVSKAKNSDSFIIIPSQQKVDPLLEEQLTVSFQFALDHIKKYTRKVHKHHEVLVYFENKNAHYQGCSLGLTITIGLIEELTKYYNLPYIINVKNNITLTGGMNGEGVILPVSEKIIRDKLQIVFYSPIEQFIIPKSDEAAAIFLLDKLKKMFPKRNLQIIPINTINELLDRRSIVEIKKRSPVVRIAKTIKKNWIASILSMLMFLLLILVFIKDWDDNPHSVDFKGKDLLVNNKLGKVLWTLPLQNDEESNRINNVNYQQCRIIDINGDGVNEVLVSYEAKEIAKDEYGRISCYDKNKILLWKFTLNDSVSTKMEKFSPDFILQLFDTTTRNGIRELYLTAAHASSNFPSAICRINLLTGERIPGVFWHAGRIGDGVIVKNPASNKKTLVACFINNGFKHIGLFQIDLEDLNGQAPTDETRTFIGIPQANLTNFILTPNSDYNKYFGKLYADLLINSIQDAPERDKIIFTVLEGTDKNTTSIAYEFSYDFKKVDIVTSSDFERARDSLVVQGKINPPKSYTPEYQEKLKSGIKSWNGKLFEYPYKKSR